MRTCVRVGARPLLRAGGARGDRSVEVVQRGAAPARHAGRRREPRDAAQVRAATSGTSRPTTSTRARLSASSWPRGVQRPLAEYLTDGLDLQPRIAEATPLRRRAEAASLRAVRRRRAVAGPSDGADPRPRQRRRRRQPAREPPDRLPELRGDARYALRPQQAASVPLVRGDVPAGAHGRRGTARNACWTSSRRGARPIEPDRRKVERPSYEQLLADLRELSWVAVGRKYGVSDNAVRKWLRRYEAERTRAPRIEGRRVTVDRALLACGVTARLELDSPLRCAADAHPDRRRHGRRPPDPRDGRVGRRSRDAARGGAQRDAVHGLLGRARDRRRGVRRRGDRRRRRPGERDRAADPRQGLGAGGGRDRHRARVLRLADLLPRRAGHAAQHRRDLGVDRRVRRQGRAGHADRGDPRQPGRRAAGQDRARDAGARQAARGAADRHRA